jgi:RNA recognition motif-containing protein
VQLFVRNLPFAVDSDYLSEVFGKYGEVARASVPRHVEGGRSKGFGFVNMPIEGDAQAAILALNGAEWDGRILTVEESNSVSRSSPMQTAGAR